MDRLRAVLELLGWVVALGACVMSGGMLGSWVGGHASLLPGGLTTATILVYALIAIGGAGGMVSFWYGASAFDFCWQGYQMRWQSGRRWIYEEFGAGGMLRSMEVLVEPLEDRYAPPCRVAVPTADEWDNETPTWAHGRRDAILARFTKELSAGWGAPVTFVPPGAVEDHGPLPRRRTTGWS